ncbi:MAG: lysozyme inhibitor LprI family protein [Maritimibacter sp.]
MIRAARLALLALGLAPSASAQGLLFDFTLTTRCVEAASSWETQMACIGTSAGACMDANQGGYSTYGQAECFGAEHEAWDAWLNRLYPQLTEVSQASDADRLPGAPSQVEALREMQRAWITYRDRSCAFEAAVFGGGTGAGPAYAGCLMVETGEQVLRLNGFVGQP